MERFGDLLTWGPRTTRREQGEGPSSSPAQYCSVLHSKIPFQELWREVQLIHQTSVGCISVGLYLRTILGCSRAPEPLWDAHSPVSELMLPLTTGVSEPSALVWLEGRVNVLLGLAVIALSIQQLFCFWGTLTWTHNKPKLSQDSTRLLCSTVESQVC